MKSTFLIATLLSALLSACGAEVAGTAAVVGKMQAEEAQRAREQLERIQKSLDETQRLSQQRLDAVDNPAE
jgi:TolA-binding protein